MRRACIGVVLAAGVVLALGCESIAGIEDRSYEPGVTGSPECETYCDLMDKGCTEGNQQYPDRATCILTCDALPRTGEAALSNGVECRSAQANLAISTGEAGTHCPAAGPFGKGSCGSTCEAYCELQAKICPDNLAGISDCVGSCAALKVSGVYDLSQIQTGDTLECRVAALSRASVDANECGNASFFPRSSQCSDPESAAPACADYCRVVMAACTGGLAVFESDAQCQAVCMALPAGTIGDTGTAPGVTQHNTVGCRLYHSYSSLAAPETHCSHAGPGGDGHCGLDEGTLTANCEAYCQLVKQGCASEFAAQFTDHGQCMTSCATLSDAKKDTKFTVGGATGDTLACRFLHVARALEGTPGMCDAAVGLAAPCM